MGRNFIDGDYVEDVAGTPFESGYPATGEVIAHLHATTLDIVKKPSHRSPASRSARKKY